MEHTNVAPLGQANTRDLMSSIEIVTPATARHLRDTAHFDRQRNINERNVARLAAEMAAGRFTPGTQIYICVLPDGSELIVNGNHTLEAVDRAGVPQILTITRKAVPNADAAGRIYAVFDIQKLRTWRDSLRAAGTGNDIPNAGQVLSAIGIIERGFAQFSFGAESRIDRIEKMEEYRVAAQLMADATAGAPKHNLGLIRRAAIMAVALETFRYQPSLASEFWGRIAHDDGLTSKMPEKALLHWLRNSRAAGGALSQREHCRAAALAWNAAFRGEQRHYLRPNSMVSFFILGTPWSHGLKGQ